MTTNIEREFKEAEAILNGHFILSSGLHSNKYIQCARVLMNPARADRVCNALAEKILEQFPHGSFDVVVSPAMGGVIVGYEMGRQLGLNSIFCERVDGNFTFRRGFGIKEGDRVLVVEDVVTTGKSSKETFECIKKHGGVVVAEASLIDRSNGNANLGVPLISLIELEVETYKEDELPEELKRIEAVKPGSRFLK